MAEFVTHIEIAAPPERVWAVMSDVVRWPEWTASVSRVEPLGDGAPGVGYAARVQQPKLQPAVWRMTQWQPPRVFAWESKSPGVTAIGIHEVVAAGNGSRVTLTVRYAGLLAPLVALLAGQLTRDYMQLEAEGLRERSEGRR